MNGCLLQRVRPAGRGEIYPRNKGDNRMMTRWEIVALAALIVGLQIEIVWRIR